MVVSDNIKLLFTYLIAFIVIVGGGLMLYGIRLDDPDNTNSANLSLLLAGFIGSAITYAFGRETATQATRASQASTAAGVASQNGIGPANADAMEAQARKHSV